MSILLKKYDKNMDTENGSYCGYKWKNKNLNNQALCFYEIKLFVACLIQNLRGDNKWIDVVILFQESFQPPHFPMWTMLILYFTALVLFCQS